MDRQTYMEINIGNFNNNVSVLHDLAFNKGKQIMPILKANGYGTYINKVSDIINEFKIIGLAICSEAIELRNNGYSNDILILNEPYIEDIENIIKYNLIVGVSSFKFIDTIGKKGDPIKVFIEIETGMGRTGVKPENLQKCISLVQSYPNIEVVGCYTHFCVADSDSNDNTEFTNRQIRVFDEAVKSLKASFPNIKYISSEASDGLLKYNDQEANITRPGLILYGYEPYVGAFNGLDLKPIAKLKSKISFIKNISENESIGYGRTFISNKPMKIATVGIGYADGLPRELSNKGEVVINGKKSKILGIICMDSFMCDVTDIDCNEGDEVYIWDNDLVTIEDIASKCNTINYEILSRISDRVPRIFI